jgi:hypothetical protein
VAKKQKPSLRKNLFDIINVGSVGMTGGGAWKSAGVLRMGATGEGLPKASGRAPKFGNFRNLGF